MSIDADLVRRLVADQFPEWAGLPVEPVSNQGWDNRTFRLGDKLAVRLPSAECYVAQVDKEHHWLPIIGSRVSLQVPEPVAKGSSAPDYPWPWSVYRWLHGESAAVAPVDNRAALALALANFLEELQRVDSACGPPAGPHNFFRGGLLSHYDVETRAALVRLDSETDVPMAEAVWNAALEAEWRGLEVWLHGDVAATNLLVREGKLSAVIDFGCVGIGDPACDLTIAWTFFHGTSRDAFVEAAPADDAMWARARGWALWKGLITLVEQLERRSSTERARSVIADVVDEVRKGNR